MSISTGWTTNEEINIFREYLRIPTVYPNVNYDDCISFLRRQAIALQLPIQIHNAGGDSRLPYVIITWTGSEPTQGAVLLNAHMDLGPVHREKWIHNPFGADIDAEGRIFGRGAQEAKCVGTQYLGAIRELKQQGFTPKRTIHVMFIPDKENGNAMQKIVKSDEFYYLNVAFCLDEGIASKTAQFPIFYAERAAWLVTICLPSTEGQGSLQQNATAGEKLASLFTNISRFRSDELCRLEENPDLTLGDVTTINLTKIRGGDQVDVVASSIKVSFDVRLALDVNHEVFLGELERWCHEAGVNVAMEFTSKSPPVKPTHLNETNVFWVEFEKVINELELNTKLRVFESATDSRFLREAGIPVIGFTPINQTPALLHTNDEYLAASTYLRGIEIYTKLLTRISNA